MRTAIVYRLTCRVNGKVYIGITCKSLEKRWQVHVRPTVLKRGGALQLAIRKYGPDAFDREVLEIVAVDQAPERERELIAAHNSMVPHGYNMTAGGEQHPGGTLSQEVRAKISAANSGKPGRVWSPEAIAEMSAKQRGRFKNHKKPPRSDEYRAKLAQAARNRRHSAETRAKIARAATGQSPSKETREKISEANAGRKRSPETRARISAGQLGKKRGPASPETKEKMRLAAIRRHARRRESDSQAALGPDQGLLGSEA